MTESDVMTAFEWYSLREADHRAPTSDDFARLEKRLQGAVPDEFRSFIAAYGDGAPRRRCWFPIPGGSSWGSWGLVDRFIGFSDTNGLPDAIFELLDDRIPPGMIPFAYDPGGNLLLFAVSGSKPRGSVWFWDHEGRANSENPGMPPDDTYFVAGGLGDFLHSFRSERGGG